MALDIRVKTQRQLSTTVKTKVNEQTARLSVQTQPVTAIEQIEIIYQLDDGYF